jgi:hypothetical protein
MVLKYESKIKNFLIEIKELEKNKKEIDDKVLIDLYIKNVSNKYWNGYRNIERFLGNSKYFKSVESIKERNNLIENEKELFNKLVKLINKYELVSLLNKSNKEKVNYEDLKDIF